jgi:hypothetical protein
MKYTTIANVCASIGLKPSYAGAFLPGLKLLGFPL